MKKLLTVIGAAAAGLAAGILMAPKSGKETREDLKKKAQEYKDVAEKKTEQAKAAAKDGYDSLKTGAQKVGDVAGKAARDVKSSVEKQLK